MNPIPLIHDGDHGSDDLIVSLMALAAPEIIDLKGIISCRGNVGAAQAAGNACLAVQMAGNSGSGTCPVYTGADDPVQGPAIAEDLACGLQGLGQFNPGKVDMAPLEEGDGIDWLIDTTRNAPAPLTLCVTGPATNTALALTRAPDIAANIREIVVMGGCLDPQGPANRRGNITPFAEFNFYMDPAAADIVLGGPAPVTLLPLDVTHQLTFGPARQAQMKSALSGRFGEDVVVIMRAAEDLHIQGFGGDGAVIHDQQNLLYLMDADLYDTTPYRLQVVPPEDADKRGHLYVSAEPGRPHVNVVTHLRDPDKAFQMMVSLLARLGQTDGT